MNSYLIDTNVLSELSKPLPNEGVKRWLKEIQPERLFASVVTLGEMRLGIESLPEGKKRSDLEKWLESGLPDWFATSLLPITAAIADRWARITVTAKRGGLQPSTMDCMIAATAIEHSLTLVTRNVRDFVDLGVTFVNPWPSEAGRLN